MSDKKANDYQVGGNHYRKVEGEQHWDRAWRLYGPGPFQYQITKYVERYRDKQGIQDLVKARHFIEKLIELEEAKEREENTTELHKWELHIGKKPKEVTEPINWNKVYATPEDESDIEEMYRDPDRPANDTMTFGDPVTFTPPAPATAEDVERMKVHIGEPSKSKTTLHETVYVEHGKEYTPAPIKTDEEMAEAIDDLLPPDVTHMFHPSGSGVTFCLCDDFEQDKIHVTSDATKVTCPKCQWLTMVSKAPTVQEVTAKKKGKK